jgi:peptidoglycan/LPS O-acetylase OafA/YrhL
MTTETPPRPEAARRVPGTAGLLPTLTGLRFMSAAMIFAFHATYQLAFASPHVTALTTDWMKEAGPMAVDFFFILSGFILTWTAKPGLPKTTFWRRRFARIYPSHFVTWVAALVLVFAFGPRPSFLTTVPNLFLVHSWVPRGDVMFSMNFVTWSLSCEAFFYFSFPFLYRWVRRIRPERLWAWSAACVAIVLVVPLIAVQLPTRPLFFDQPVWQIWLVQNFPLTSALQFVLGMLMARIVMSGRWPDIGLVPAAAIATAAFALGRLLPHLYGSASVGLTLALVVAAGATADVKGRFTLFRNPTMVRLGECTYVFYLVHWLVLNYGHAALGKGRTWDTPTALALIATGLVIACAITWVVHTYVEVPMERRISGRVRGASQTPDPQKVAALIEEEHREAHDGRAPVDRSATRT